MDDIIPSKKILSPRSENTTNHRIYGHKTTRLQCFFEKTVVTPENSGRDGFIQKDDF